MQLSKNKTTGVDLPVAKRSRLAKHETKLKSETVLGGGSIYSFEKEPSSRQAERFRLQRAIFS
jgi:hypothetical protein